METDDRFSPAPESLAADETLELVFSACRPKGVTKTVLPALGDKLLSMSPRTRGCLKKKAARRCPPEQADPVPPHFHYALIIEEDEELRRALVQLLKERGWLVHGIRRAEQALPILGRISYHLIIADAELPGLGGIEFARMLHQTREWGSIPVIVLTSTRSHKATQVGAYVIRRSAWCNELTKTLAGIEADLDEKGEI